MQCCRPLCCGSKEYSFLNIMLILGIIFSLTTAAASTEKLTPLHPGDPYSVIGDVENRQMGRCTYLYAWLAIPQGSHQDIYAHNSACSRLELRFMQAARESRILQQDFKVNVAEGLSTVDKDFTAQLIDLETLDSLLQAVKVINGIQTSPPLTSKDRIFYLADRLGQYTMLAMLRPGRLPKIEIIPPPTEKTHIHPQNVLCYRKLCDTSFSSAKSTTVQTNSSMVNVLLLAAAKQENRHLYVQLIIYRALFALATFLCLLFGISALVLCCRGRKSSSLPKKPTKMEASYHNGLPYNSLNGGYKITTPVIFTDQLGYPLNATHVPSDTASLHNTAVSSNLSGCELITSVGCNGNSYTHLSYQPHYLTDGSGVLKPITQTRMHGSSTQNFYPVVPLERSGSPVSEGYRTGSLDRRSDIASEKLRRRTPIQVIALPQGAEAPPTASYIPLPQIFSTFKPVHSPSHDQTITSQGSNSTVVHKFSGDLGFHSPLNGQAAQ